ncbi:hypothetical protein [Massilia sp. TWR1-2-2]|uniref:hypothetical protein n=1 Tax=Massilia sp. TWR1-2-2 TaxID=2804584 RepID=UPI003CF4C2D4
MCQLPGRDHINARSASRREETGDYTRALDTLFQRHPEDLAGLADSWAMLRPTFPPATE